MAGRSNGRFASVISRLSASRPHPCRILDRLAWVPPSRLGLNVQRQRSVAENKLAATWWHPSDLAQASQKINSFGSSAATTTP
jgi:hypothetical protein